MSLAPVISTSQDKPAPVVKEQPPKTFKEISFEEKHKDWPAVTLLHETRITVHMDWSYEVYIHRKILVQTKDGFPLGEIPIDYNSDTEEVRVLRAVTTTPDGKEHPYAKEQDLSVYEDRMYSDAKQKTLSLAEVTVGAVIDLEYVVTVKRLPMPKTFWNISYTKSLLPIREQKLTYRFPTSLGIKYKTFITSWKPEIREKDGTTVYHWERKNYSPNTDEEEVFPPLPTEENIGDGIEFSSLQGWQEVAVWYYGLIQKNMRVTSAIRKAAEKAAKGKTALREKVRAILEYMQENFRYVSMSFGDHSVEPHATDEVFRNKYGDCKDQSLLMKAMLEAVGVRAELCFFTTEAEGTDPKVDLPALGFYDHVLLRVADPVGGDFYADPLLQGYDIGEYPLKYQGAYTFVIRPKGGEFERFPVFDEARMSESTVGTIEIHPDGSSTDTFMNVWKLHESIDLRRKLKAATAEEKKKFFEKLEADLAEDGKVLEQKIEGLDSKYGRLKSRSVCVYPNTYPVNDGLMVVDLARPESPDGWNAKERKSPLFSPTNGLNQETVTFKLPNGFEVMHLPKGFILDNGFFSFRRNIERNGNSVKITDVRRIRRMELPASAFPKIKEFYAKLSSRTEQRIILRKKEA